MLSQDLLHATIPPGIQANSRQVHEEQADRTQQQQLQDISETLSEDTSGRHFPEKYFWCQILSGKNIGCHNCSSQVCELLAQAASMKCAQEFAALAVISSTTELLAKNETKGYLSTGLLKRFVCGHV